MPEIKCQFCGQVMKNQGAKNLHERRCKQNPNSVKNQESNTGCEHNWRLLKATDKRENYAIEKGYKEICIKCDDIR